MVDHVNPHGRDPVWKHSCTNSTRVSHLERSTGSSRLESNNQSFKWSARILLGPGAFPRLSPDTAWATSASEGTSSEMSKGATVTGRGGACGSSLVYSATRSLVTRWRSSREGLGGLSPAWRYHARIRTQASCRWPARRSLSASAPTLSTRRSRSAWMAFLSRHRKARRSLNALEESRRRAAYSCTRAQVASDNHDCQGGR
jgi:hypothetical protein